VEYPKFACICLTFDRTDLLPRALYSYLEQDYPDDRAELIILDDAGQYRSQSGDEGKPWELVSVSRRFSSIGAKRNAAISMVSPDVDAIVIWDDDDVYLPWTLRAHAVALADGDWSRPSLVIDHRNDGIELCEASEQYVFHAAWAFRLDIFKSSGGYGDIISGEDKDLASKFIDGGVKCVDPIGLGFDPYFVFNRFGTSYHISYMSSEGYRTLKPGGLLVDKLGPRKWDNDFVAISHDLMDARRLKESDRSNMLYRLMESFGV